MLDPSNKYTQMQKKFFEGTSMNMRKRDHSEHNDNPDYWEILLSNIQEYKNGTAMDFGSGTGRNVINLLKTNNFGLVHGVDISERNCKFAHNKTLDLGFPERKFKYIHNNGVDLKGLKDDFYDFIMSTITLQHICVYDIRKNLLKEIYRCLKPGGEFSFQMGFDPKKNPRCRKYHDNYYQAKSTNSANDVQINKMEQIVNDLNDIGFVDHEITIRPSWSDNVHSNWIFIKTHK